MQSSWSIQVKYSTYQKSSIFCFAQLLMQIKTGTDLEYAGPEV